MKAFSTLLALAAIVFIVFISADLFVKEQYFLSSTLIVTWIVSIILWVKAAGALINGQTFSGKARKA